MLNCLTFCLYLLNPCATFVSAKIISYFAKSKYYTTKSSIMLTINPTIYEQLASILCESIKSDEFYSDLISLETPEVDYTLSSTLIISHRLVDYPEGCHSEIYDICPVWWKLTSVTDEGEQLNDFDFNILKNLICLK